MGVARGLRIAFIIIIIAAILFPIYWIASISFKTDEEVKRFTLYPVNPTLENYVVMGSRQWAVGIRNSLIISIANLALCLVAAFPAAYVFTRTHFKADKHLFFWLICNRLAPPAAFIVPYFMIYMSIGLYDTLLGVIVVHSIFNLPLAIWILSGFMKDIPTTIDEASFIDGYSTIGFWRKVFIPQLLPAIGVMAFFLWMFSWTEMLLASIVTRNEAFPLTVQLLITKSSMLWGVLYGQAAAAGTISMIPGLVILYFVRDYIARGFMLGRV